ncbi:hypothetical protein Cylst_4484 [Cylindrospermum stagnale PCC 7417]|uniref:Bacterial toxin 50 domain-containing protein n=1 Tax=Cylindrospermum stagnale PCC 7417 TaxID=56107 RepID=K9X3B1_9NOST|nr:polymorphic toxin type 50 domain-containing protein [Cylindrospermum stagnale]AFZ26564.1 hypothetical protein Cylst_4484 [Cylindrospermum stagnale PCC 7417]
MKLTRLQPGDMYQQEPVSSNPVAIQPQANTDLSPAQNTTLEPFEKADEVSNEAVEIQRLSEPGDNGDTVEPQQDIEPQTETTNPTNAEIGIQRACSECEAEKEEKKDTGIIQAKAQIAGFNKNLFKPSLLNQPTHTLQAKTLEEQSPKSALNNNNQNEFSLTKQSPTPLPAKEISSQNPQIVQMMPKPKPGSMTLQEAQQALKRLNGELGLELAQTAADLAGLADPTPISDGVGAAISIARGDYVGAGLSLISMVPYLGDAAGKPIKAARNGKRILKLRKEIAELIQIIEKLSPEARRASGKTGDAVTQQMKRVLEPTLQNPVKKPVKVSQSHLKIESAKQGKHQAGHNNFIPGRSAFTHPNPQQLVNKFAGKGQPANNYQKLQPGYRERVDFGEVIGTYSDPTTGKMLPTSKGIIHYSKNGVHIVPSKT